MKHFNSSNLECHHILIQGVIINKITYFMANYKVSMILFQLNHDQEMNEKCLDGK